MLKEAIGISILVFSGMSHAAVNGLSVHSRNNCGNNESISWSALATHHLGTNSRHYHKDGSNHYFGSGIEYTWRSAAVHWGEGIGGWIRVQGEHYLFQNGSTKLIWLKLTDVKDCSVYDGWWESDPPEGVSK